MLARLIACVFFGYFCMGLFVSSAIVRKSELLARWSFDDGNGTIANEALGTGVDGILKEGATWGLAENAMSQGSLDISSGNGYALVASHPNLQSRIGFSTSLWFKSNGQVADYAQILSKDGDTYLSYFSQVEQGSAQITTQYRFFGSYENNGAISFNPYQWHFWSLLMTGQILKHTLMPN